MSDSIAHYDEEIFVGIGCESKDIIEPGSEIIENVKDLIKKAKAKNKDYEKIELVIYLPGMIYHESDADDFYYAIGIIDNICNHSFQNLIEYKKIMDNFLSEYNDELLEIKFDNFSPPNTILGLINMEEYEKYIEKNDSEYEEEYDSDEDYDSEDAYDGQTRYSQYLYSIQMKTFDSRRKKAFRDRRRNNNTKESVEEIIKSESVEEIIKSLPSGLLQVLPRLKTVLPGFSEILPGIFLENSTEI